MEGENRNTHFNFGNVQTDYVSQACEMTGHNITSEDISVKLSHLNKRKGDMRKTNFKMPYV